MQSEERLHLVGKATTDIIWDWDLVSGSVWCNRFEGSDWGWWNERAHPDDREQNAARVRAAIESGAKGWTHACRFRREDGTYAHMVDRAVIVRDVGGRATRVVGSIADVSDILKAREESATLAGLLEQSNRIAGLGRLCATVAHEFNNVLMSIQPHAEVIRRKGGDAVAATRSATAIEQGVQRGKRITEEILRFARPVEPTLVPVPLGEWLQRFAQDVRAVNMPNIDLDLTTMSNGTAVLADVRQIEQLLWNLVINARDAMPDGGRISIASGACAECGDKCDILPPDELEPFACIRVSDTGPGIPAELLPKIFEPLYTTKKNGTGLGLAVAHQIATRHRGYIFVRSEPGEGATFYVLLRRAVKATAAI